MSADTSGVGALLGALVVVVEPGKDPQIRRIANFDEAKTLIGGYVERVRLFGYDVLCDEDGLTKRLPLNRMIPGTVIHGTFIVTKLRNNNTGLATLTKAEASKIAKGMR